MSFKNILVALDGSEYSQTAADYAVWLAAELDATLTGQHVVDPRISDLFIAPEFGEELGLGQAIDTSERVYRVLKKLGNVILDIFSKKAFARSLMVQTHLDTGYVVEEIVKRSKDHDLVVMGHRGRGYRKSSPAEILIGSIAERVAVSADCSVLIAVRPLDTVEQILVAYDGSEPSRGALLAGERLALQTRKKLKAMTVATSAKDMPNAQITIEQGQGYLREYQGEEVFMVRQGHAPKELMDYAAASNSLLVLGSYGFKDPNETVMGSTTTYVVRRTTTSVLIYR